jgi:hypothetical protein
MADYSMPMIMESKRVIVAKKQAGRGLGADGIPWARHNFLLLKW